MKYIVKFNEKYDILDIESYCRNYLSYMLDDPNIYLEVIDSKTLSQCRKTFPIISIRSKQDRIKWDDIKDYFIPFVNILVKEYNIYRIEINGLNTFGTIQNIINDNIGNISIYKIDIIFRDNQENFRKKRGLE